jgi:hypothetical protein
VRFQSGWFPVKDYYGRFLTVCPLNEARGLMQKQNQCGLLLHSAVPFGHQPRVQFTNMDYPWWNWKADLKPGKRMNWTSNRNRTPVQKQLPGQ